MEKELNKNCLSCGLLMTQMKETSSDSYRQYNLILQILIELERKGEMDLFAGDCPLEDTILRWSETEGYPVDGTVGPDGQYSKADIPEHTQYDTDSLAKFAFSMFWQAMQFAEEQQVPILLDY